MKKIKDIRTNVTSYGESYILDNQLAGRILVDENNSFEGLLFHDYEPHLVFGSFNKDKMEMILKTDSSDKLYRVQRDGQTYYGDCFIKENNFEYPIGECLVDVMNADEYRTLFPGEEKLLEEEIQKLKTTKKN